MTVRILLSLGLFAAATAAVTYIASRMVYRSWMLEDRTVGGSRFGRQVTAYLYETGQRQGDPFLPAGSPGSVPYWDCTYIYHYDTKKGEKEKFYDCYFLERPPEEIVLRLTPFGVRGPKARSGLKKDGFVQGGENMLWWLPACFVVVFVLVFGAVSMMLMG